MALCLDAFAAVGHDSNGKGRSERGISCCQWNFSTKLAREGCDEMACSKDCLNGFDGERQYSWTCERTKITLTEWDPDMKGCARIFNPDLGNHFWARSIHAWANLVGRRHGLDRVRLAHCVR